MKLSRYPFRETWRSECALNAKKKKKNVTGLPKMRCAKNLIVTCMHSNNMYIHMHLYTQRIYSKTYMWMHIIVYAARLHYERLLDFGNTHILRRLIHPYCRDLLRNFSVIWTRRELPTPGDLFSNYAEQTSEFFGEISNLVWSIIWTKWICPELRSRWLVANTTIGDFRYFSMLIRMDVKNYITFECSV